MPFSRNVVVAVVLMYAMLWWHCRKMQYFATMWRYGSKWWISSFKWSGRMQVEPAQKYKLCRSVRIQVCPTFHAFQPPSLSCPCFLVHISLTIDSPLYAKQKMMYKENILSAPST